MIARILLLDGMGSITLRHGRLWFSGYSFSDELSCIMFIRILYHHMAVIE